MIIPRVGDYWEFELPSGNKTRKTITEIVWKEEGTGPYQFISWKEQGNGRRKYPLCVWSHTPKARYIGPVSVRNLLTTRKGRLISRRKPMSVIDAYL